VVLRGLHLRDHLSSAGVLAAPHHDLLLQNRCVLMHGFLGKVPEAGRAMHHSFASGQGCDRVSQNPC
jgi:hypothetical protein